MGEGKGAGRGEGGESEERGGEGGESEERGGEEKARTLRICFFFFFFLTALRNGDYGIAVRFCFWFFWFFVFWGVGSGVLEGCQKRGAP